MHPVSSTCCSSLELICSSTSSCTVWQFRCRTISSRHPAKECRLSPLALVLPCCETTHIRRQYPTHACRSYNELEAYLYFSRSGPARSLCLHIPICISMLERCTQAEPARHHGPCVLSRAALEYVTQSGRRPNVLHIHEWQTAGAALLYWEIFANRLQARCWLYLMCSRASQPELMPCCASVLSCLAVASPADMLSDATQMPRLVLTLHNMDNSGECSQEEFCYSGAPRDLRRLLRPRR